MGMAPVPEARRLFPSMSVYDNLADGCLCRRRKNRWSEIKKDLAKIIDLFPRVAERLRQNAGTLSGGEQQMVAVGRALMARPKLILMDEPSMGLAPTLVDKIYEIIRQIKVTGYQHADRRAECDDGAVGRRTAPTSFRMAKSCSQGSGHELLRSEAFARPISEALTD